MRVILPDKETIPFSLLRCGDTFLFMFDSTQGNMPVSVCMKGYHEEQVSKHTSGTEWETKVTTVIILETGEVFDIVQTDRAVVLAQGQFVVDE